MDEELVDEDGKALSPGQKRDHPFGRWLRRVFGKEEESRSPKPPADAVGPPP